MAFTVFNQPLTITRTTAGQYVNGVWQSGTESTIDIKTSIQPANEVELKLLPEGRREDGSYALRTRTELRTQDKATIYGEEYEVLKVQVWQNGIIPHYHAIATKVQA